MRSGCIEDFRNIYFLFLLRFWFGTSVQPESCRSFRGIYVAKIVVSEHRNLLVHECPDLGGYPVCCRDLRSPTVIRLIYRQKFVIDHRDIRSGTLRLIQSWLLEDPGLGAPRVLEELTFSSLCCRHSLLEAILNSLIFGHLPVECVLDDPWRIYITNCRKSDLWDS